MRLDLSAILPWFSDNSKVLDLGCGDGQLLAALKQKKNVQGYGLEISAENIAKCVARGVNVIEQNLDDGLDNFANNSFDTVVMTQALQVLRNPDKTLAEMLRIGEECIVTFPNFGHWNNRLQLAFKGHMPMSETIPYHWYNTPNIHFCTLQDFEALCQQLNIYIAQRDVLTSSPIDNVGKQLLPNLFGEIAVYRLKKAQ